MSTFNLTYDDINKLREDASIALCQRLRSLGAADRIEAEIDEIAGMLPNNVNLNERKVPEPIYRTDLPKQAGGDMGCICRTCGMANAVYLDQCAGCRQKSTVADDRRFLAPGGEWERRMRWTPK